MAKKMTTQQRLLIELIAQARDPQYRLRLAAEGEREQAERAAREVEEERQRNLERYYVAEVVEGGLNIVEVHDGADYGMSYTKVSVTTDDIRSMTRGETIMHWGFKLMGFSMVNWEKQTVEIAYVNAKDWDNRKPGDKVVSFDSLEAIEEARNADK